MRFQYPLSNRSPQRLFQWQHQFKASIVGALLMAILPGISLSAEPRLAKSWVAILANPSAEAKAIRYVPPVRRKPAKQTQGGGSRGCGATAQRTHQLWIPRDHVGLTQSAYPSFYWSSVTANAQPVQISVVAPGLLKPIWTTRLSSTRAGLNQVSLPTTIPGLQLGQRYRWIVSQACNDRPDSEQIYQRGWIERVTLDASQTAKITAATQLDTRAQAFASEGLWYDAIALYVQLYQAKPTDTLRAQDLLGILQQEGLKAQL